MEEKFVITEIDRVVMVGKDEYPNALLSLSPIVRQNELIFHFSGHATVFFGDLELTTKPNTVRFLPKGEYTRYDVLRHERGECIDVCFSADRPVAPQAFTKSVSQGEKIGALFKKLFVTWVSKKDGYYFESKSLLYQIFAELQKDHSVAKEHTQKIAPAMELIQNHFLKSELTLKELAAACHMGESYFQKLFRKKYGVSPKRYIIQMKINHACDLLRFECYTVTQIAQLCHFSDVYFFSRQFKEYTGLSPLQFAKKYQSSK